MRLKTVGAALFVALLWGFARGEEEGDASTADFPDENGVFVLSEGNFDKFLEKYPTTLIEFYAPWCGHCKALAPEYEKAAETLKSKTPFVPLAKVDTTVEEALGTKFDVKGFPTLKFWKDGEKSDYDGPRDADGIVQWVQERTDPNYKPPPESVLTLTQENFATTVNEADLILVEFYAPWCGHCKKLAPEFEKASQRLQAHKPPIILAKVDATKESDLAKEYGVSGYPTLKIFRHGRRFDYNGPREADGIVAYMKEQAVPAAKELKTVKEVQRFMDQRDVTVLGFFATEEDKTFKNFGDAAEASREEVKKYGYTLDPEVMSHFKGKPGQIGVYHPEIFHSKYEDNQKFLDKPGATQEDIQAFVRDNAVPLVGERTHENKGLRYSKKPLVAIYYTVDFSPAHREGTQYWRNKVLKVAKDYKKTYTFALCDEEQFAKELEEAGLADSGLDINVIVYGKDGKRYPMDPNVYDDDFSEALFRKFMEKINTGHVKPFIKSQPAPRDDKSPVKTLVASNFDSIVRDESKDVLVEFYAPWCGHCKQFEPTYKELAVKLKKESNLVIAKFDGTANDPPENFAVQGFPTIYFAPSGKKSDPIQYTGSRTLDSVEQFLKENAVASFKKTEL